MRWKELGAHKLSASLEKAPGVRLSAETKNAEVSILRMDIPSAHPPAAEMQVLRDARMVVPGPDLEQIKGARPVCGHPGGTGQSLVGGVPSDLQMHEAHLAVSDLEGDPHPSFKWYFNNMTTAGRWNATFGFASQC